MSADTDPRRASLGALRAELGALSSLPRDDDGPVFRAPWEAQAFGMTLALYERGQFTWKEWADRLATEIAGSRDRDDGSRYYELWLTALEKLVADKGLVMDAELARRRDEWAQAAADTPHGQPIELKRARSASD
jgi:nitrile hydratase accessory protein